MSDKRDTHIQTQQSLGNESCISAPKHHIHVQPQGAPERNIHVQPKAMPEHDFCILLPKRDICVQPKLVPERDLHISLPKYESRVQTHLTKFKSELGDPNP